VDVERLIFALPFLITIKIASRFDLCSMKSVLSLVVGCTASINTITHIIDIVNNVYERKNTSYGKNKSLLIQSNPLKVRLYGLLTILLALSSNG